MFCLVKTLVELASLLDVLSHKIGEDHGVIGPNLSFGHEAPEIQS